MPWYPTLDLSVPSYTAGCRFPQSVEGIAPVARLSQSYSLFECTIWSNPAPRYQVPIPLSIKRWVLAPYRAVSVYRPCIG